MSEIRNIYRISNANSLQSIVSDLNRILLGISDRLDKMEGRRGTPEFYSNTLSFPNGNFTNGAYLSATNSTTLQVIEKDLTAELAESQDTQYIAVLEKEINDLKKITILEMEA
jgi:hypothetical protein